MKNQRYKVIDTEKMYEIAGDNLLDLNDLKIIVNLSEVRGGKPNLTAKQVVAALKGICDNDCDKCYFYHGKVCYLMEQPDKWSIDEVLEQLKIKNAAKK